jgi:hypothetical protein
MIEFTKEQNHSVLQFMWQGCVKTTEGYAICVALNKPVTVSVQAFQLQGDYLDKQDVSNYREY